jgi:uncharacterized membrane protein
MFLAIRPSPGADEPGQSTSWMRTLFRTARPWNGTDSMPRRSDNESRQREAELQETAADKSRRPAQRAEDPPPVDRLRKDIDRGATGEKIPYPDPAAAPMGTDEEAAGAPPSAQERQKELDARPSHEVEREGSSRAISVYLGAALVAGVLLIAMAILLE